MFEQMCTDCGWKSADTCKQCCKERSTLRQDQPQAKLLWSSDVVLEDIQLFADPVERQAAYEAARQELHGVTFGNNDDGCLTPVVF